MKVMPLALVLNVLVLTLTPAKADNLPELNVTNDMVQSWKSGDKFIRINLTAAGQKTNCDFFTKWTGHQVRVLVNKTLIAAPMIHEPMCEDSMSIYGNLLETEKTLPADKKISPAD